MIESGAPLQQQRRNNILLIVTDQERWFPSSPAPLPAHDRLRRAGTSFERYYAASVACSPARAVMYTGLHSIMAGVVDNVGSAQGAMATGVETVGARLRRAGYHTAYKGKWHLSPHPRAADPERRVADELEPYGFSDYSLGGDGSPFQGYEGDVRILADAVCWMRSTGQELNSRGVPWFLAVNFVNPHDVMFATWDKAFADAGGAARLGMRPFLGPPDNEIYRATWDQEIEPGCFDPVDALGRPRVHGIFRASTRLLLGSSPAPGDDELRLLRDYYVNCIRDVDTAVDGVLDEVERLRIGDRTSIVYTSDHGEMSGAHGLFGKGPCAYDENIRLPLIIVEPGAPRGAVTDAICSQLDLVPTMLGLAELDATAPERAGLNGMDLMRSVRREPAGSWRSRSHALFAYNGLNYLDPDWRTAQMRARLQGGVLPADRAWGTQSLMRTIVTERYKLTRYFAPLDFGAPTSIPEVLRRDTLELFDLEEDPGECRNVAPAHDAATVGLLEELLEQLAALIDDELGEDTPANMPPVAGAPWLVSS